MSEIAVEAYNNSLLEQAWTQWLFGDWRSLENISRRSLEGHPDRAKLATLAASGHYQNSSLDEARALLALALEWGADRRLVTQMLVSGAYQTLANAYLLQGERTRALGLIQKAIATGAPTSDKSLVSQARLHGLRRWCREVSSVNQGVFIADLTELELDSLHSESPTEKITQEVDDVLCAPDLHEAVNEALRAKPLSSRVRFLCQLSDALQKGGDRLSATHFIQLPFGLGWALSPKDHSRLVEQLLKLGHDKLAAKYAYEQLLASSSALSLDDASRSKLNRAFTAVYDQSTKGQMHGHDLLLAHLKARPATPADQLEARALTLVEIGSTRELVPGQGSTAELAAFCKDQNIHFITVDMDPQNSRFAQACFDGLKTNFHAVTQRGEDFLAAYSGRLDFVFLDAYDFDHGNHSELRQSRYERFLGARISDEECHQMHLKCAMAIVQKLSPDGLVCFDDTWIEDGLWVAKGTTAMPYLLENGFEVVEARNRAAILRRVRPNDSAQQSS
jgi:tetratricopeptide (TPR) repeat protein